MAHAQTQQTPAPKVQDTAAPEAQPAEVKLADTADALAAASRTATGGFDADRIRAASVAVAAAVRADDSEVGKYLLKRGRKALTAELDAIFEPADGKAS